MESLDVVILERVGPGASPLADATARLASVRLAGWNAQTLLLDTRGGAEAVVRGLRAFGDEDALADALEDVSRSRPPRAVLIADTTSPSLALLVPEEIQIVHWPVALGDPPGARERRTPPRWAPLEALAAGSPRGAEALDLAPLAPPAAGRGRLPLWDGDYILAPAPLDSAARTRLIEAFARFADEDSSLDLVMLDDPDPAGEALARRLDVGMRVHFAGIAPPDAETAWLGSATAIVFGRAEALRASLVLLALACGSPIVQAGTGSASLALGAWLEERGCGWQTAGSPLDAALAAALERGAEVGRAVSAGRGEAARHAPEALAARLGSRDSRSLRAA